MELFFHQNEECRTANKVGLTNGYFLLYLKHGILLDGKI